MVLIVGATGLVGGEACRLLRIKGEPVRALVRATSNRERVDLLRGLGCELVEGDLKSRASLDAACAGATAVISTASATLSRGGGDSLASVDLAGQVSLVDAARAAGVRHFVFVSFRPKPEIAFPLQDSKLAVERAIQQSGMSWTILRASLFMEVWLSPVQGFDPSKYAATILGSGDAKISWVSAKDVAAFAVESLTNSKARDAVVELGGPQALSMKEVVRTFEDFGGRKFKVQQVPEEAIRAQYDGAADPMQKTFAALGLFAAQGDAIDMTQTVRDFNVPLTSVRDYAKMLYGYRREGTAVPD